jgi:hypothetical protein
MTPEERELLDRLCTQIKDEKDHDKFIQLVTQLNDLLERKENRLESQQAKPLHEQKPSGVADG